MSIRAFLTILAVAIGLTGSAASGGSNAEPVVVRAQPTFFINGHGWGHGLGMSQYGAYGYAQHGWKYDRILKHYYTGTTIGQASISRVRVLLSDGVKKVTISSKLPFRVVDASGKKYPLDGGSYVVGPSFKLKQDPSDPATQPQPLVYPLEFRPGSTAVALNGRGYRGFFRLLKVGTGKLRVVNVVDLDLYLRGVVPSEMPKDWAPEALKAQAVAARSYALSHLHSSGGFDLYPDTRDQVYLGIPHEASATTTAVTATAGQVVLYKGRVASTYFFSTSGGRTASLQDVYPDAAPVPYLVSVADPYDSISPYHEWGPYQLTQRKLGRKLKVPGRLLDVQTVAAPSGRVQEVVATGTKGQATAAGPALRVALGLRSTWFRVGVLVLGAPAKPVTYGSAAALSGIARGVSSVELQQRAGSGAWETVTKLTPKGGTIAPKVKPGSSSKFRLLFGSIASAPVGVAVSPSVRLHVPADLSGFWGTVKPLGPGASVQVQRQAGLGWRPVAVAPTNANGRFTIARPVGSGTYRARVVVKGFAPGFSRPVTIA
jgi:stage II sporulation protein D